MTTRRSKLARLTLIAIFALLLSSSAAAFGGVAVGFGINVGFAPPPVPVAREVVVASPGPGYAWVGGHWGWYPTYGYRWVGGAWLRPPYPRAVWVAPRFVVGARGRFFYRSLDATGNSLASTRRSRLRSSLKSWEMLFVGFIGLERDFAFSYIAQYFWGAGLNPAKGSRPASLSASL